MSLVYRNSQEGMKRFFKGDKLFERYGDIQEVINTSNKRRALEIMNDAGIAYVQV